MIVENQRAEVLPSMPSNKCKDCSCKGEGIEVEILLLVLPLLAVDWSGVR